jgi:PAS domain S-box-containing protein
MPPDKFRIPTATKRLLRPLELMVTERSLKRAGGVAPRGGGALDISLALIQAALNLAYRQIFHERGWINVLAFSRTRKRGPDWDGVPCHFWSVNPNGEVTYLNQRLLDYFWIRFEDRKWDLKVLHPDDISETERALNHAFQTGESFERVHRLRRADGEYRWHRVRAEPQRDPEGQIVQWYGLSVDIDERKRSEERLRVQHAVAQILAKAATIEEATPRILRAIGEYLGWDVGALWRVDREAGTLRCVELWHKASIEVPEFERVSRETTFVPGLGLPGRVWSSLEPEYVPDVVSDENFPRASIAEREGLHAAFGFPILLGSEVLGVIECFSREIRQPDQELLNMLATIGSQIGQFIERKRAEQALRESEAKFRAAIDGIAGLVAIMAPSGELEAVNGPIIEYFGRTAEELKNWGTSDAVHPEDLPRVLKSYKTSLATGTPFHQELRLRRFDGEYRWFENRGAPIRDETGRITRWYCLLVDIEDRIRALERLHQLQSDFAHMNRVSMMGELAASLSHEIMQPIASARNNARAAQNFLDMQPLELGEIREALRCVVGDTDRAGDIVDRIRDHIKKAPLRKALCDLNVAIDEVVGLARSAIVQNGVSVQSRLAEGLSPVPGDRVQLQQVVLNLILNAVEAMSSVEAGARELLISTEQDYTGVRVALCDSGPGIDAAHLERVFDAFYTTKPKGSGMGLSICRSIINAHGGRLWAETNEPRGTVFQFTLPSAENTS